MRSIHICSQWNVHSVSNTQYCVMHVVCAKPEAVTKSGRPQNNSTPQIILQFHYNCTKCKNTEGRAARAACQTIDTYMQPIPTHQSNSHDLGRKHTLDTHLEFTRRLPNMHYNSKHLLCFIYSVVQNSITRYDSKTEHRFPQSLWLFVWGLPCSSSHLQPFFCGNRKNSTSQNAQNAEGRHDNSMPNELLHMHTSDPIPTRHIKLT